jgi:hypoxanthine phosphoribosyltransferase
MVPRQLANYSTRHFNRTLRASCEHGKCQAGFLHSLIDRWSGSPLKTLLSEQELRAGVERMASCITRRYGAQPLTIVAVMTGSLVLLADLIRRLSMPVRVSLIQASSYRGGTLSGEMRIREDMMLDVANRDVLIIDDIFDTGKTLEAIARCVHAMSPRSVSTAVLLHKEGRQQVELVPDFIAFNIPDEFVVGYGLDYADLYRNLPYLAILEPSEIEAVSI